MSKFKPFILNQTTINLPIEIYICYPTQFIVDNAYNLLPTWTVIPKSILIVLLHAKLPIEIINKETQIEKERLKKEFLQLGNKFKSILQQNNCFIEIIDPQNGKQMNQNTTMNFDMIAIVNQTLSFDYYHTKQGCKVLDHPTQKTAIYPSIIVSDTDPINMYNFLEKAF